VMKPNRYALNTIAVSLMLGVSVAMWQARRVKKLERPSNAVRQGFLGFHADRFSTDSVAGTCHRLASTLQGRRN